MKQQIMKTYYVRGYSFLKVKAYSKSEALQMLKKHYMVYGFIPTISKIVEQ